MNLSYKILSVSGISIELHLSFLIFILLFAVLNPSVAILLLTVFFFVTLHELSHAMVAVRNKIPVKKIVLVPIGGVAVIDSPRINPVTEIKMALAGPLMNVLIAVLIYLAAKAMNIPLWDWTVSLLTVENFALPMLQMILVYSFYANVMLAAFNLLLPAFPLDGGRVLRALLALKMDYLTATKIASTVSLAIAGFLLVISIRAMNFWIIILTIFISLGAIAEYQTLLMQAALNKIDKKEIIMKAKLIPKRMKIKKAVEKMMKQKQLNAITSDARLVNLDNLIRAENKEKAVGTKSVAIRQFTGKEELLKIIQYMNSTGTDVVPIAKKGKLIGTIQKKDIGKQLRKLRKPGK